MRYLPLAEVQEGMVLGRTVYDNLGQVLLNEGTAIKKVYIDRLREFGYPALYIRSPWDTEESGFIEPIRQETVLRAKSALHDMVASYEGGVPQSSLDRLTRVVGDLIDELLSSRELLLNVVEIRSYDTYTFGHSVSTAILSVMAGAYMGLNRSELTDLGVGAILHDIGKIFVPTEILNKPARLTEAEFDEVKTHCRRGYHVLRDQINLLSAHVAYQHHERCDGSGYPRGLKKQDILLFAKIVAVADSYDAMTSERVYSTGMFPHEAGAALLNDAKDRYDLECVKAILRNVAPYPIGSIVVTDSGETGEVVEATRDATTIRITHGPRTGTAVRCPDEAEIVQRVGWGKWK